MKTMERTQRKRPLLCLLALAALTSSTFAAKDGPVKVYILSGQSNMVGMNPLILLSQQRCRPLDCR